MFKNSNKLLSAIPGTLKLGEKNNIPLSIFVKNGEGIKGRGCIGQY
jgi:sRNA-binding regulator protein Hfq